MVTGFTGTESLAEAEIVTVLWYVEVTVETLVLLRVKLPLV